ncbi:hypothetical protein F5887DRAFT_1077529 [Amanita rubescens]|nr:hypothetical protein F5887DRAFT_1077529 [Amanita rubescens]
MATMLTGAAVMDAALLLIAGNETCLIPQTSEHLATEVQALEHQKISLPLLEERSLEHHQLCSFPHNFDVVNEYILYELEILRRLLPPVLARRSAKRWHYLVESRNINVSGVGGSVQHSHYWK